MVPRISHWLPLVVLAAVWSFGAPSAEARHRTSPDLFYNYYVPSGDCGGVGAQMYVSPRPTPPMVGHTGITYQPLMPSEYLYTHKRSYVRNNPGAGRTFTRVKWGHHPLQDMVPSWMDGKIMKHLFVNPFSSYGMYYSP